MLKYKTTLLSILSLQPGDAGQSGAALHPRGLRHVGGLQRSAGPGAGHHLHDRKGAGSGGGGGCWTGWHGSARLTGEPAGAL